MRYPFRCRDCNKKFELDLSIEQYAKLGSLVCPKCESTNIGRTFTPVLVKYTGNGFYTTDYEKSGHGTSESTG